MNSSSAFCLFGKTNTSRHIIGFRNHCGIFMWYILGADLVSLVPLKSMSADDIAYINEVNPNGDILL